MTQIGNAYAQGLYALAAEEGLEDEVLQQLAVLENAMGEDYVRLLSCSAISKQERCQLLDQAFRGKVHIYVLNTMKLMTEKGCIRQFGGCCRAFREYYDKEHGILPVRAVSAVALTALQQERLTDKLNKLTGKTVRIQNIVDPRVLGGVRLDYDGKRIDGTVKNRLDQLAKLLEDTVL